ncbi:histone h1-binding protein [Niveomyces insectorum RCEF 264]|uniref:Histone h1-binding protein n=1 Tax=Niveomyces insectorum RCEF 264 TaxID=1081102 RepID=A0A167RZ00_9HYPO|nr:histone h1-binding protein [Niveomyces insectorum RCEF 264]
MADNTAPHVASAVPAGMLTPSGASTPGGPVTGAGTGTVTPAMSELPPDQVTYSLKVSLADLCAKAAVLYSQQKNYEEAAELYARAAEMQAEINGEMDPENAEILFLYGRALFKVGQSKSDVLGGKAPEAGEPAAPAKTAKPPAKADKAAPGLIAQAISKGGDDATVAGSGSGSGSAATKVEDAALEAKKPLFQFAGDEEWDASEEEDADAADEEKGEEDEEEDEDDLAVAFEVLDLARVLFEKRLEELKANDAAAAATVTSDDAATSKDKGKEAEAKDTTAETFGDDNADDDAQGDAAPAGDRAVGGSLRHILERLADTHDLLAEISLENERYPNAIVDSRASLAYKKQFLPEESEIIAEAHFKLSLALEFASVTTTSSAGEGQTGSAAAAAEGKDQQQQQQVDQELRDEAARELEAAIASTKLKLQNKEVELATLHSPEDNESTRRQIADVKDMIADMEQRLVDLRKPPIDLNAAVNGPAGAGLGGLLGALSGAAGGRDAANVEEAKRVATDLTGLVRKRAKDAPTGAAAVAASTTTTTTTKPSSSETANGHDHENGSSNGTKRKAEAPAAGEDEETKKARTVDAA